MFENALRQSLILFDGNPVVFLTRPISGIFLVISALLLLSNVAPWMRGKKRLLADAG
jgi:TctA family transporter